jgi:hypothetical protein
MQIISEIEFFLKELKHEPLTKRERQAKLLLKQSLSHIKNEKFELLKLRQKLSEKSNYIFGPFEL